MGGLDGYLNAGLNKIGEGADQLAESVGGLVDSGTDALSDGLRYVGADGAADAVAGFGDSVASDLGATVAEAQLGATSDPRQLVHGDAEALRESARQLTTFNAAFDQVGEGMRGLDSSTWQGEAAEAFRSKFSLHPAKWLHAADACAEAAEALNRFAETVEWAQGQAEQALALYEQGRSRSESAVSAYNAQVAAYNTKVRQGAEPGPEPGPFTDPGQADMQRAADLLEEARRQRDDMGRMATGLVDKALAHAPAEPPPLDQLKADGMDFALGAQTEATHFVGGLVQGTAGLVTFVRGLNPTDPYSVTHPAEYLQNVSMTLSGLVSTVARPDRALSDAWEGFKQDPAEGLGRLVPELLGTRGAGLARGGVRLGARTADGLVDPGPPRPRDRVADDPPRTSREESCVCSNGTDPIDLATGHMYLPQTDVSLPGVLPLLFKRRVESGYRQGRWFGPSWSSTVDQRLEIDSEGVVLVDEDGLMLAYPHPAPGVPVLPSHGPRRPLDRAADGGGYTVTDPETGRVRHFTNRGEHLALLEQIDDRNGNWITFSYDADGAPTALTHSAGHHIRVSTANGRVTALHLMGAGSGGPGQELIRYGYDDAGNLTEVTNSSGRPFRFTYDGAGRVTSWTDTNDRRYTYAYDASDRCVAEGGSEGHFALRLDYDGTDPETGMRETRVVTGEGHVRRYLVGPDHQVRAEIDELGAVTRFRRDRYNRLLSTTDPLGHTTTHEYDDRGNLVRTVRPDGRESLAEYNDLGLPVRTVGTDGTVRRYAYDPRGNLTAVVEPTGATTRYAYDEAGAPVAVTDALGATTRVRCDAAGLPVEIVDPLGAVTRYERDAFGRPVRITDPLGATTLLSWTVEGRLARRTRADGSSESWTYDGEGNCTSHTDAMGAVSTYAYTHFDVLAARTGANGVRYEFQHDTELRLRKVVAPQGLTWTYEYDPAGRLISETDFDGRTLTYAYDRAGRLVSRTNALGQTVTFERNALGQVVRKDVDGEVTTYAYDLTDQVSEARTAEVSLTLLRDQHGLLRKETANGHELAHDYDALGRRVRRTTPSGAVSTWTYDAAGNRTELTTSGRSLTFTHDAAGRELARSVRGAMTLTSTFDPLGRLTRQELPDGRERVRSRAYAYRPDGRLVGVDDSRTGARSFDLDTAGRVTAVRAANWTESYAYDEAGNQTRATWPDRMPGRDAKGPRAYTGTRIRSAGRVRYAHDAAGRVTLRQRSRPSRKPDTWRYTWDAEDRMTSVVTPDGTRWRYVYDPLGRRVAKCRMAPDGRSVVERTDFTWDGPNLCEQTTHLPDSTQDALTLTWEHHGLRPLTQTERRTARRAPGRGEGQAPERSEGAAGNAMDQGEADSRFYAIVTDLVGTPTELLDERGDPAWRALTTLWGATGWAANARAYTPLRFPGQYFDPESGLHYNVHRYYDPETARYTSPDPLGLIAAPNPVTYVSNPHVWIDPFGLAPTAAGCGGKNPEESAPSSRPGGSPPATPVEVVGPGEVRHGDVDGNVIVRGGTVHGNVNGAAVVVEGGTVTGNARYVVEIGPHNVIGQLGPPGANSVVGSLFEKAVQAGRVLGDIYVHGQKIWPQE